MRKALQAAQKALSFGEFPVGCIVVIDNRIVATGLRSGTAGGHTNETDHAEITALRQLDRLSDPLNREGTTIYSTLEPCLMCFGAILIHGIRNVVYAYEDVMGGATGCDLKGLPALYQNSKPHIVPGVLRNESLELFKTFFSDPDNQYWKGSLLARYTLEQ
jgi:tRNA(adenine34) deaminase